MNTTLTQILVTSKPMRCIKAPNAPHVPGAVAKSKIKHRFRAEFVSGPHAGSSVNGFATSDEAIGALIRQAAYSYESADEQLDFLAGLFGDIAVRAADEQLGRAVRFANRDGRRRNPGLEIEYREPANERPRTALAKPTSEMMVEVERRQEPRAAKGGAA